MISHKENGIHSEECCKEVDYKFAQLRSVNKDLAEALDNCRRYIDENEGDEFYIVEKAEMALARQKELEGYD